MRKRPWSAEDMATLIQMRKEGKSAKEIGIVLGRSVAAVQQYVIRNGLSDNEGRRYPTSFTEYDDSFIMNNWGRMRIREIAAALDRNISSINYRRRRLLEIEEGRENESQND